MSIDRREAALACVHDLLKTIVGLATDADGNPCAYRNRDSLPPELRPGLLLLDADEAADTGIVDKGRDARTPNMVLVKPEIYICLSNSKPTNTGVGTLLNQFRANIVRTLCTDTTLKGILGTNGEVFYAGAITDLARRRAMQGEMGVAFWLKYPMIPGELPSA